MEMDELLEEAKVEFKRWHFKQTWKYTNAFNATYENIRQLEGKYKEEEDTKEVVNEEVTREEEKQISLLEEDEDEKTPIRKLIRKQEVVYPTSISKTKKHKDQATNVDGEWVETRMKKMIYGVVIPKIEHPTLAKNTSVKLYPKSDMVHMLLELEYVLPLLPNP